MSQSENNKFDRYQLIMDTVVKHHKEFEEEFEKIKAMSEDELREYQEMRKKERIERIMRGIDRCIERADSIWKDESSSISREEKAVHCIMLSMLKTEIEQVLGINQELPGDEKRFLDWCIKNVK